MITEALLDQIIDQIVSEQTGMVDFYETSAGVYPVLVGYLTDRDTHWLTDPEHEYLLYLGMIVVRTLQSAAYLKTDIDREHLDTLEEDLWQQLEASGAKPLDKLRAQMPTDGVLSDFVLDALERDEELAFLTEPGAQLIYVKLTALIGATESPS